MRMRTFSQLADLTGRTALITGGAGYLGIRMAHALAQMGCNIVLIDLKEEQLEIIVRNLIDQYGIEVEYLVCDLEKDIGSMDICKYISNRFGRLDILINNAAFGGTSPLPGWATDFENQDIGTWRRAIEVNLTSAFILSQKCVSLLRLSENGCIINIGSIYGVYGPNPSLYSGTAMGNPAAYAVSKAGLIQLTRWMATSLAPTIRVNAISPGGIERGQNKEFVKRYIDGTPLRRMGTEEDMIGGIVFLASDLSKWVTGQNIFIDGGWGVW